MSVGKEGVHLGLLDDMDHEAKWGADAEYRKTELRIQALGAAISRRDWHTTEQAYAAIRDKFYSHSAAATNRMRSALQQCEDYFDDRSDIVDGSYGEPAPNTEMRLLTEIREALGEAQD